MEPIIQPGVHQRIIIYVVANMMKGSELQKGFTLVEMLLVLVISTSIIMMFLGYVTQTSQQTRRDIATMQIQQILNAALAYYVSNGSWPEVSSTTSVCTDSSGGDVIGSGDVLTSNKYLQAGSNWKGPYGNGYRTCVDPSTNIFYVISRLSVGVSTTPANAAAIAGQLPSGIVVDETSGSAIPPFNTGTGFSGVAVGSYCNASDNCIVISSVPPPGQNLNNARSVNFASVYHSSSCVPAPTCPTGMVPQIFVVPTSVSGVNDIPTNCTNNTTAGCTVNVYPISSYTGYAVGYTTAPPAQGAANPMGYGYIGAPEYLTTGSSTMPPCTSGGTAAVCYASNANSSGGSITTPIAAPGYYWRVCLGIVTERGKVTPTAVGAEPSPWGLLEGSVMAITRCVPGSLSTGVVSEPIGSDFTVFNSSGN